MSNSNHYIIDTPLSPGQDFNGLKNEGLAFIQEHMGNEWTNLNPSDPGVTILEQLCYALTELGYCNDFEIQDILTNDKGQVDIKDQFYQPQEILTTAPVTLNDYRKYLIDTVAGVENAIVVKEENVVGSISYVYHTYLLIDPKYDSDSIPKICRAAHFYLNKSRNLGEFFSLPKALMPEKFLVAGIVEIDKQADLQIILQQIQQNINNYIFPKVVAEGYYSSSSSGIAVDEIFNGPLLNNGFILTESLGTKKNILLSIDMVALIRQVSGVVSVSGIAFSKEAGIVSQISCNNSAVLWLDIMTSVKSSLLKITVNGNEVASVLRDIAAPALIWDPVDEVGFVYGEKPVNTTLQKGVYRDINAYYSIQNTFPAVFAVGADGPAPNASDFQVAQSRQLKGYLTLMDQLLANQFSQIANINRLFSFKNSLTGAPADLIQFMHLQDPFERDKNECPVPFINFSPVYFYQSLYDIPNIRPLLKDNRTYNFSEVPAPDDATNDKGWTEYKQDPYNAYMFGLMKITENDECNLDRRNDMLDHLLARHGESPLLIDEYINDAFYSGTLLQEKVIIKSLYLQNYDLLSYNRIKAYNYLGAEKLGIDKANSKALPDEAEAKTTAFFPLNKLIPEEYSVDNIINSGKINHVEKLTGVDFINYSSVELKLSMLFGLRPLYRNFISDKTGKIKEEIDQAEWLITKRRGVIMIETGLLLQTLWHAEADLNRSETYLPDSLFQQQVLFIFPGYISTFKTQEFNSRLNLFFQNEIPVTVNYAVYTIDDCFIFQAVIDAFIRWHDDIRYCDNENAGQYQRYAEDLIKKLIMALSFLPKK
ncbi:MAG: hypothetical protein IPP72_16890 [Chitinophagaceae bacterium]|nr:hypothetical protein [Chitinophagaceae bacterium]